MNGITQSDRELAEKYRNLNDDNDSSQFERSRMRKMLLQRLHAPSYAELEKQVDRLLYGSPSTPKRSSSREETPAEGENYLEKALARAEEQADLATIGDLRKIKDNWHRGKRRTA